MTSQPENPRAKRMWVEVCAIESCTFLGHLTNEPRFIDALSPGDVIEFEWKHVAQLE